MPFLTNRNTNLKFTGLLIDVVIMPPQPIVEQLTTKNLPVPSFHASALIDTGASSTCISQNIVEKIGLFAFYIQKAFTAAGETQQYLYDVGIILPITQPNIISIQAPCADLSGQSFQVLLGRDVMSQCTLFYNGPDNSFTLHF